MTTIQPRGSEMRNCYHCGVQMKVINGEARKGHGKYCSQACNDMAKSIYPAVLAQLPGTTASIAQSLGVPYKTASESIGRMVRKGLIHPTGIEAGCSAAGAVGLRFAAGPQPDKRVPLSLKLALPHFVAEAILAAMPATSAKIREKTGLEESTISNHIRAMRAVVNDRGWQQLCFIRSYKRTLGGRGPFLPVYERGPGKDQPCKIEPRTDREIYLRKKRKAMREGRAEELAERHRERQRARKRRDQRETTGDPLTNALFGTPADRRQQDRRAGNNGKPRAE